MANNTITAPRDFLAAGVKCGIKKSGKHDLGLIVCPAGAKAAAVFTTVVKGIVICFSAIDNLIKGASGQAVQNMNIVFGLDETMGLK